AGLADGGGGIATWSEIEADGLAFAPVAGDLQDGGAAEATMGEKHFFAEGRVGGFGDYFRGNAGEGGVALAIGRSEDERDEAGAGRDDFQAELAGEVVAKGGRAQFGDGESAGSYHERCGDVFGGVAEDYELRIARDLDDLAVQDDLYAGGAAFGFEHVGDVAGGVVAEELAEGFFVIGDAMFFDEGEEVCGGVACQGGFGEVGIRGEEILRLAMNVGEVAAAPAGDEDFFADAVSVFQDGDAAAALARFDGAQQACSAAADYQNVEFLRQEAPQGVRASDCGRVYLRWRRFRLPLRNGLVSDDSNYRVLPHRKSTSSDNPNPSPVVPYTWC